MAKSTIAHPLVTIRRINGIANGVHSNCREVSDHSINRRNPLAYEPTKDKRAQKIVKPDYIGYFGTKLRLEQEQWLAEVADKNE